mmetsp:Transcript_25036/g.59319  ORF Transcript_25036/g.59319 Transcript_25036/m.59319 type:complete len:96 (-) Transcript_25036:1285-1572(-)
MALQGMALTCLHPSIKEIKICVFITIAGHTLRTTPVIKHLTSRGSSGCLNDRFVRMVQAPNQVEMAQAALRQRLCNSFGTTSLHEATSKAQVHEA